MKKKIFLLATAVFMLAGCGEIAKMENGEDAVVTFGSEGGISINELYTEVKDKYAINALVDMIDTNILTKEYPDSTKDKEDYVKENLEAMKANYTDETQFLQVIKYYYGSNSEEEFKEYLALNYLRNLAIEDYSESLVKDAEVKAYYKKNTVGDIQASHILISIDDDTTEAQALEKATKLINQLNKSTTVKEDFAKLAKENSDDTGSASNGGDLGFFNKGEMYTEFETAAYALKVDQYTTKPIKTTVGYHIIYKTAEKEKPALDEVKDEIIKTLGKEKLEKDATIQLDALTTLRKKYKLQIEDAELSKQYSTYLQNILYNINNQNN